MWYNPHMNQFLITATPALVTAMGGLLAWFLKEQYDAKRQMIAARAATGALEHTVLTTVTMILKNQLVAAHRSAVSEHCISITERDTFLETYAMYKELQGRPALTHLHEDILKLPLAEGEK